MGDEAVKIFLNADGTMDDVSRELKAFLDYVAGQKPADSYVEKLEEPDSTILQKLQEKFLLTKEESQKYLSKNI